MLQCFHYLCNHRSESVECEIFPFPKDPGTLKKWKMFAHRANRVPGMFDGLCSCHFVDHDRTNPPTKFVKRRKIKKPTLKKIFLKENCTLSAFKNNFNVSETTFESLLKILNPIYEKKYPHFGSLQPYLLVFLWTVASNEPYRIIAQRFGVVKNNMTLLIQRVGDMLKDYAYLFIRWPTQDNLEAIKRGFEDKGFPNTIGAIGASYLRIQPPSKMRNKDVYLSKKKFRSMILLAACDHRGRFTNIHSGFPGSLSPSTVLRLVELGEVLMPNSDNPAPGEEEDIKERTLTDLFPCDTHLIGSGFPLRRGLMTPYNTTNQLSKKQHNYNVQLLSAKLIIDQAFHALKSRFKRLNYLAFQLKETATRIIVSCCVLHNLCLEIEADTDLCSGIDFDPDTNSDVEDDCDECEGLEDMVAISKRDQICSQIFSS